MRVFDIFVVIVMWEIARYMLINMFRYFPKGPRVEYK
jgi:hypothetical protein